MNFQLDDDLSDGSNDSFFEDPKVLSRKSSGPKQTEKKFVSDLFNLTDNTEKTKDIFSSLDSTIKGTSSTLQKTNKPSFDHDDDILGTRKNRAETVGLQKTKKASFEDDDDILGVMGLDKKKNRAQSPVKKTDILDSILAPKQEERKHLSFEDILKESKFNKKDTTQPKSLENSVPPAKLPEKPNQGFSLLEPMREGRRGRRPSTGLADPLGLFETRTEEPKSLEIEPKKIAREETVIIKEPPKNPSSDLPDWLSGAPSKPTKTEPIAPIPQTIQQKTETEAISEAPKVQSEAKSLESNELFSSYMAGQKIAQSDLEVQNSFLSLQQQESQLLMALQLKKYEESLMDIQKQQQEVLVKQEKQFNIILDRYLSKQQMMENNMKLQQERINNHIQMLISNVPTLKSGERESEEKLQKVADEEAVHLHAKIMEALKTRHNEEVFILEESYKKQIFLLEQSLEKVEDRLKEENKSLAESYEEKVSKLKESHQEEIKAFESRLLKTEEMHKDDIEKLKENYRRVIDDIKNEHATQLEVLKQKKDYESNLFKDSNNYSQKLDQSINLLSNNSLIMQNLQENMQEKFSVLTVARESSLAGKEKEIQLMKETLEKCREAAELERTQLLGMVRSLETKIAEQNNCSREERWALQQASATLAARAAALDREMEFNRASVEREREQLKTLKESLLAEQEQIILNLNEQKLTITSERARLETAAKLNNNFEHQKSKAEVEAAMQVAKESAEMTDRERGNLQRQLLEVEKLKRTLIDKERRLEEREEEIRGILFEAQCKSQEADKAIKDSKTMESKYRDRFKELQVQHFSLTNREKKLAEEKIALSKERLMLYAQMRQRKKCGLCEADNLNENHYEPELINILDEETHRIRFDLNDEEEKNSEVSREFSV